MVSSITVTNSAGDTVATIPAKTVDTSSPLTMIGRGFSGFAKIMNENWYRMLENWAGTTAPSNPVEGQFWYDTANGLKYWNSTAWVLVATGGTSEVKLARLSTASNINFNATGAHQLHTAATGVKTIITSILLIPQSGASVATTPPAFSLETSTNTANVADKIVMAGVTAATKYGRYLFQGSNAIVTAGSTVSLNIKTAIAGGDTLICDAYLYGLVI